MHRALSHLLRLIINLPFVAFAFLKEAHDLLINCILLAYLLFLLMFLLGRSVTN
jgi:hypothetical protein